MLARRTRILRQRSLVLFTALALVGASAPASAAAPFDPFKEKMREGNEADQAGDASAAIDAYVEAYESLPPAQRADRNAGFYVVQRVWGLARAPLSDGQLDPVLVQRAIELLERHIEDVKKVGDGYTASLEKQKAELTSLLDEPVEPTFPGTDDESNATTSQDESIAGSNPADTVSRPSDSPAPIAPSPRNDRAPGRDPLSIGLLSSGAVALAGGIGLMVGGGVHMSITERELDRVREDGSCMAPSCDLDAWHAQERREHIGLLAGGAILAAAGVALVTTGAVLLVKRKAGAKRRGRTARVNLEVAPGGLRLAW